MPKIDVLTVINAHQEGDLLHPCIKSVIQAADVANKAGINCKIILILDRADSATKDIAYKYDDSIQVFEVNFGDLARSRNFGVSRFEAAYITFIDGDDLWGHNWIKSCFGTCEALDERRIVVHPRCSMYFGRNVVPHFWFHPDMREDRISIEDILVTNRWTALSFAPAEIYMKHPYIENRLSDGFGYEDWVWHLRTIGNGIVHIVANDTVHLVRRKTSGSLLGESNRKSVLPYFMGSLTMS